MKFLNVIAFGFLPTVFGAALPWEETPTVAPEKRILGSDIVAAVKQVNTGVQALDAAVESVTSADVTALLAVNSAAADLTTTITSAQATVEAADNLEIVGSLAVALATDSLVASTKKLSKDIIAIKPYVDEAGVTSTVETTIQGQKTSADAFADTVTAKVPSLLRVIASLSKSQIDDALDEAIQAYSSSSTSSGSPPSSSSGSSPSASSGSSPSASSPATPSSTVR